MKNYAVRYFIEDWNKPVEGSPTNLGNGAACTGTPYGYTDKLSIISTVIEDDGQPDTRLMLDPSMDADDIQGIIDACERVKGRLLWAKALDAIQKEGRMPIFVLDIDQRAKLSASKRGEFPFIDSEWPGELKEVRGDMGYQLLTRSLSAFVMAILTKDTEHMFCGTNDRLQSAINAFMSDEQRPMIIYSSDAYNFSFNGSECGGDVKAYARLDTSISTLFDAIFATVESK